MKQTNSEIAQGACGIHVAPDTSGCSVECIPELVRKRAYEIFEKRGRRPGDDLGDWLQAEREIKHHLNIP